MTVHLALAVLAVIVLRVGFLYLAPFGPCPKCKGTGHIKRGKRRRPVCPRCKGRKRIQRTGSRTIHRLVFKIRTGSAPPPATSSRRTTMGHADGAHTHGGGGFDPMPILIIIGAIAVAGPVAATAAELLHLLVIVLVVLVAVAGAGLVAYCAYRVSRRGQETPRLAYRATVAPPRSSPLRSEPRPAIDAPRQVHLHFHGSDPADVAEIIRRHGQQGVNPPGG